MKKGPIILIDDDKEDCELITEAIRECHYNNEVVTFSDPDEAYAGMVTLVKSTSPFVILCDINLPRMNGIQLKQKIDATPSLRSRSIPFVFLSTSGDDHFVNMAYDCCTVQGFFMKASRHQDLVADIKLVLDYWKRAKTPSG